VQWLGLIFGVVLFATAVYYFLAGFFPESGVGQRMRSRIEFTADVRRAKGYTPNTAALYAWMLRTKPRVAVLVLFLLFWSIWFGSAGFRT
jgi:hypothetical protein